MRSFADRKKPPQAGAASARFASSPRTLQSTIGNRAVHRIMKASLDGPRDEHEREADRVAERVSSSVPHGGISQANRAAGDPAPPIVEDVLGTRGKPLDAATRAFMEPRLGHDLAD